MLNFNVKECLPELLIGDNLIIYLMSQVVNFESIVDFRNVFLGPKVHLTIPLKRALVKSFCQFVSGFVSACKFRVFGRNIVNRHEPSAVGKMLIY